MIIEFLELGIMSVIEKIIIGIFSFVDLIKYGEVGQKYALIIVSAFSILGTITIGIVRKVWEEYNQNKPKKKRSKKNVLSLKKKKKVKRVNKQQNKNGDKPVKIELKKEIKTPGVKRKYTRKSSK